MKQEKSAKSNRAVRNTPSASRAASPRKLAVARKPSSSVWVTTSFEGYHRWPDAPRPREYLRNRHRHKFNVRAELAVTHDDRQLEFHNLKDAVEMFCSVFAKEMRHNKDFSMSCEMLARRLIAKLEYQFPLNPVISVSVDEDGECGATVTFGI